MSEKLYRYELVVVEAEDGSAVAYLDEVGSPLRGAGSGPLEAVRALCETLREWPIGGSDRWLTTDDGVGLARQFVPGFERGKPPGSA